MAGALLVAAVVAFGACGGDDDGDTVGDVATEATDRVDDVRTEVTDLVTPGAGDSTPGAGGAASTLEISSKDIESFSTDQLQAPAGTITIVYTNQEDGVIHNLALFEEEGDTQEIASTDLEAGPGEQRLTVTLEAGEYYYACQVHPNMNGTLTVAG
jgi:plastocyanin